MAIFVERNGNEFKVIKTYIAKDINGNDIEVKDYDSAMGVTRQFIVDEIEKIESDLIEFNEILKMIDAI